MIDNVRPESLIISVPRSRPVDEITCDVARVTAVAREPADTTESSGVGNCLPGPDCARRTGAPQLVMIS